MESVLFSNHQLGTTDAITKTGIDAEKKDPG